MREAATDYVEALGRCENPNTAPPIDPASSSTCSPHSAILALGLLGPRVSEFGAARWRDLSAQELFIPEAKTSAGRRHLELPAVVRAALDSRRNELDPRPGDYIWASAAGTKRDRNNVRNRLLAPVLELGAQLLADRGQRPLPARLDGEGNPTGIRVTPHMFRRTAMTYWAWTDRNQRWAMGQAGHKSAKMTLDAYQQTSRAIPRRERRSCPGCAEPARIRIDAVFTQRRAAAARFACASASVAWS